MLTDILERDFHAVSRSRKLQIGAAIRERKSFFKWLLILTNQIKFSRCFSRVGISHLGPKTIRSTASDFIPRIYLLIPLARSRGLSTTTVTQTSTTTTAEPRSVRLVEGPRGSLYEGFVDILHNGVYGTICNDNFDDVDAKVICGMLGFKYVCKMFTDYFPNMMYLFSEINCIRWHSHFKSTKQYKMFFDHVELTLI